MAPHAERPLGRIAAPLAWAFAAAAHSRRFAYDTGLFSARHAGVFTISVGGIEAGGSGKTPVAAWVLGACRELGMRPGLLTRGYGRGSRGLVVARPAEATPERVGDEPAMLARELDVPVAASGRRLPGAQALGAIGCDALVLDDGFSHRALARDLDIVVLRAEAPLGNGWLLPAGTLRESMKGLGRAHVLWAHSRSGGRDAALLDRLAVGDVLRVTSEDGPLTVLGAGGAAVDIAGKRVVAACGIARPSVFEATLRRHGADVARLVGFPDHVRYTAADMGALSRCVAEVGAQALVVTAKDAVKLDLAGLSVPVWVARASLRIVHGEAALRERLRLGRESRTA